MESSRRIVLQLVALGRVTPAEAERLLMAMNDREVFWAVATALTLYSLGKVARSAELLAHMLLPQGLITLQHVLRLATHLSGGIL